MKALCLVGRALMGAAQRPLVIGVPFEEERPESRREGVIVAQTGSPQGGNSNALGPVTDGSRGLS